MLALVSGLCPKVFGDQNDGQNNLQVELMLLCSTGVSVASSAVFLALNG